MANMIILAAGDITRTKAAVNGEEITIQAPCNCSAVTGVQIADVAYPFCDAAGNPLPMGTGLFTEGSLIRVMIDTVNTRAMILNHSTVSKGVFDSLARKTLMTDETAAKYGLSGANATVDNALDALAHYLLSQGITTVTVLDEDGNPIPGVTFSGVVGSSGEAVSTDASGVAQVVVTTDVPVTFHTEYIDIPDYTETLTPNYEEVNTATIVMPYAASGHIETVLDSGSVKFRKARTVNVALVGGGNGGEPGESTHGEQNPGGSGGAGGKIYNVSKSVAAETAYPFVMGAGGVGRGRNAYTDEDYKAQNGGNTTAFGETSASGTATTLAFSNSSIMAGGKGGTGGTAPSGNGYDGVRCGGKGGRGADNVSGGQYSFGGDGYEGSAPGGGGGGGGGRAYDVGMHSASGTSYAGDGGDGGAGGVLIKF